MSCQAISFHLNHGLTRDLTQGETLESRRESTARGSLDDLDRDRQNASNSTFNKLNQYFHYKTFKSLYIFYLRKILKQIQS